MHIIGTSARPDWPLAIVVSAGGMGVATARRLSQRHRILIADINEQRAAAAAEAIRNEGGDATHIGCDITDEPSVAALVKRAETLGSFRVLAHVAGLSPSMGSFDDLINVNLRGAALMTELLLPLATRGCAAILIASLAGHNVRIAPEIEALLKQPLQPELAQRIAAVLAEQQQQATPQIAYQLSKYAVIAYCRRQATAWGARGARIVSLSPGLIASPQGAREFEHSQGKRRLYARSPMQREGTMLEIADAIEFLASDKASFISGTDLLVDGGLAGTLSDP
jgi:NAD(P)-dependent dehydrogenase (short-subunit alcohol dehydrogenase family)